MRRGRSETYTMLLMLLIALVGTGFAQSNYQLKIDGPSKIRGSVSSTLKISVQTTEPSIEGQIKLTVPPEFSVDPATIPIKAALKNVDKTVVLKPTSGAHSASKLPILVEFYAITPSSPSPGVLAASQTSTFEFDNGNIRLSWYYVLGLIGILIGYFLRLAVKVLNSITPPSPAPPKDGDTSGWFTRFTKEHYYLIDCFVTLVLGFLALLVLAKDGFPPSSAATWPGVIGTGVGLGLLTNSELISKVK